MEIVQGGKDNWARRFVYKVAIHPPLGNAWQHRSPDLKTLGEELHKIMVEHEQHETWKSLENQIPKGIQRIKERLSSFFSKPV